MNKSAEGREAAARISDFAGALRPPTVRLLRWSTASDELRAQSEHRADRRGRLFSEPPWRGIQWVEAGCLLRHWSRSLVGVLGQSPEATMPVVPAVPTSQTSASPTCWPRSGATTRAGHEIVLRPAEDGSGDLLYDGRGFRARVAPDGGVKFDDKKVTGLTPLPWLPEPVRYGVPSLQSTLRNALQGKPPPPAPRTGHQRPAARDHVGDTRGLPLPSRPARVMLEVLAGLSTAGAGERPRAVRRGRRASPPERPGPEPRREGALPGGDARHARPDGRDGARAERPPSHGRTAGAPGRHRLRFAAVDRPEARHPHRAARRDEHERRGARGRGPHQ